MDVGRKRLLRVGLLLGSLIFGFLVAEAGLRVLHLPRVYAPHSAPPQFAFPQTRGGPAPFYVNMPGGVPGGAPGGAIRFVYDGNPRGYFGPQNEVDHHTNEFGFRGGRFTRDKVPGTARLAFLGDSFTFGEGVRDEDTYAAVTARILNGLGAGQGGAGKDGRRVESYNFGVGGYNTTQALYLLQHVALRYQPDLVVLGYVLNDADPPLFRWDPESKRPVRWAREAEVLEGLADVMPPPGPLYRMRAVQLVWRAVQVRRNNDQLIAYYRGRYKDASPGWQESRRALQRISEVARARGVPFVVVIFPLLFQLDATYPYAEIHAKVRAAAEEAGAVVLDLLPRLRGKRADRLWVHPTDQHPNEEVHRIAAEALAQEIVGRRLLVTSPGPGPAPASPGAPPPSP